MMLVIFLCKYIYENSPNWVGKIEKFTRLAMLIGHPLFYNICIVIKTNHKDVNTYMNYVNTDELVHTARSSSACFPVFQCTLSVA